MDGDITINNYITSGKMDPICEVLLKYMEVNRIWGRVKAIGKTLEMTLCMVIPPFEHMYLKIFPRLPESIKH